MILDIPDGDIPLLIGIAAEVFIDQDNALMLHAKAPPFFSVVYGVCYFYCKAFGGFCQGKAAYN